MNRYAIIEHNLVVNIAVANSPLDNNWVLCGNDRVSIGWKYQNGQFIEPHQLIVYTLQNESVIINGQPAEPFAGSYHCEPEDTIQLSGEIVDNGVIVESINIPVTLKMPMIRHANGQPTQEEVYLNVTLQNGVLNAIGKIPWSGDWKVVIERNNEAIQRIGANWKLQHTDVTFLA